MPRSGKWNSRLSNPHPEPNVCDVHHTASRTFTPNQPSPAGARPEPESSSRASGTPRLYWFCGPVPPPLGRATAAKSAAPICRLLDDVQECEHAFREQRSRVFVVVGQAVVGEQVSIAGVQEQLRALDRLNKLPRGGEVLQRPLGALHRVDLEGDAGR